MDWSELEKRWQRDELLIMERNPEAHGRLAELMEEQAEGEQSEAKCLLAAGLANPVRTSARKQAAECVWAMLKDKASPAHAEQVVQLLANMEEDPWAIIYLKKLFRVMAAQQGLTSLRNSSYVAEETLAEDQGADEAGRD